MLLRAFFIYSIFFLSKSQADVNPYERGPHTVGHATFWSWSISNWDLDHNLGVWVPEASGNFPVVYFNVGVAGLIPPSFYSILLDHIASHGFVVISPFTYTSIPTFEYKAEWMEKVDQWAQENLINKIKNEGAIFRELIYFP